MKVFSIYNGITNRLKKIAVICTFTTNNRKDVFRRFLRQFSGKAGFCWDYDSKFGMFIMQMIYKKLCSTEAICQFPTFVSSEGPQRLDVNGGEWYHVVNGIKQVEGTYQ